LTRRPITPARPLLALSLTLVGLALPLPAASGGHPLSFREQSLELPGAPAALVPADLDGDRIRDLAVVVVYTHWDQIGIEERTEMDQVAGLVEVLTIVPVLLDRREVRAYLGRPEGGFVAAGEPLELPLSVLSLEPGPPGVPALALTDAGASVLRFDAAAGGLRLDPLLDDPPVLAGTGAFLADLALVRDATGDGVADLLLPAPDGLALYPGTGTGLAPEPFARVALPGEPSAEAGRTIDYPLPRIEDLDGDGLPDLLFRAPRRGGSTRLWAVRNRGGGRFAEPVRVYGQGDDDQDEAGDGDGEASADAPGDAGEAEAAESRGPDLELVHVGRLRPDGPATALFLESLENDDDGLREEMRQARAPDYRVHLRALTPELRVGEAESAPVSAIQGYLMDDEDDELPLPGGVQDLDGDGRLDLVSVTNDITLFKAMAVLATRRLTLDLGFHPWCQEPDGRFTRAPGPPLTSRLTIDLNDLELHRRSLFAGDFDGDGRADFVQLGKPRQIGIHLGRTACAYPERPDVTVKLRDELRDLALVETLDLDGDGRSDLAVTHPQRVDEPGVSPPVRLDLYLTRDSTRAGGGR
jgi:hypothetical protein